MSEIHAPTTRKQAMRNFTFIIANALLAALVMLVALSSGSVHTDFGQVVSALAGYTHDTAARVILDLRLPRVMSGFLVGGTLAIAGALMQVLLRNPLAEPYVLGVSGGASVFALLAIAAGMSAAWIQLGAFAGALISIVLVFALARIGGEWNPLRVLLTGVVIAAGWGALISFLLSVSPAAQLRGMLFWLMGDLGYSTFTQWSLLVLIAGLLVAMAFARGLNLLVRGELQAAALGVPVRQLRYGIYFLASLLTAAAVTQAGSIGFIGLIVPHLARMLIGSNHLVLLPAALLMGGSLLVVADTLSRTIIAPQQLPVGILTAVIGVPLFLFLIYTTARRQRA